MPSRYLSFFSVGLLLVGCAIDETDTTQAEGQLATSYVGCTFGTSTTYSPDYCYREGRLNTTARFRLFTSVSPTYVKWSITDIYGNPRGGSTCTSTDCSAPIPVGDMLIGNVLYYVVNGTPTLGAAATAEYQLLDRCVAAPCLTGN